MMSITLRNSSKNFYIFYLFLVRVLKTPFFAQQTCSAFVSLPHRAGGPPPGCRSPEAGWATGQGVGGLSPEAGCSHPQWSHTLPVGAKWRLVHNALVHCHHGNIDRGHWETSRGTCWDKESSRSLSEFFVVPCNYTGSYMHSHTFAAL